jgi:hypothetical protein
MTGPDVQLANLPTCNLAKSDAGAESLENQQVYAII